MEKEEGWERGREGGHGGKLSNYFGFRGGLGLSTHRSVHQKKNSPFYAEIAERKLKDSIGGGGRSEWSGRCDYAPVLAHFTLSAWRGSPAPSCGK